MRRPKLAPMPPTSIADRLRAELSEGMIADRARLTPRIDRLERRGVAAAEIERVAAAVAASRERAASRAAAVPRIVYPPELPVSERRDDIAAAIRDHQAVIVCGETGSGKTTQLPKICLELGRGVRGLIGHTQPRRIAARSVAARIAQELAVALGTAVGFKVRFTDRTGPDAYIKLMTDGILLAETQRDRLLAAYDTIIVDEAHERSLNIDFLLGYLKELLPRRPDLKVIVTSATLDAERFARHFGDGDRSAPVIEVSGRAYPVEIRHRPPAADEDDDEDPLEQAVVAAAEDLWREGPGDILVFLPGERELRAPSIRVAGRDSASVRAALGQRAAACVRPESGPAHGARDQRCRDLAYRARHPLRGRFGVGARAPLLPAQQGHAAADRED